MTRSVRHANALFDEVLRVQPAARGAEPGALERFQADYFEWQRARARAVARIVCKSGLR
jgi:hypothetical protein